MSWQLLKDFKMKKVGIIGYAPNWREAPFNDPETEIWVMNICEIPKCNFPRFDRVFDTHSWDVIKKEAVADPAGLKLIKEIGKPVYLLERNDEIASSITYPLDEMTAIFFPWARKTGHNKYDDWYWTSSIQYMLALAISENFEEIGIYGVDMSDTVEYRAQRRGCEYMLGYAVKAGITIKRSSSSVILRSKFAYGYEDKEEAAYRGYITTRKEFLQQRVNELMQKGNAAAQEKAHLDGALHAYMELEQNWLDA